MPRLSDKARDLVDNATPRDFSPLAPGKYVGRLTKVEIRNSNDGYPYWSCEYDTITSLDGEIHPGRQWYTLNLPVPGPMPAGYQPKRSNKAPEDAWAARQDAAAGNLQRWFLAHGFTSDSDTDEMIGTHALLTITKNTIQKGSRAGQEGNQVTRIEEVPEEFVDATEDAGYDSDF